MNFLNGYFLRLIALMGSCLCPAMGGRQGAQTLPIDAGGEPFPLPGTEGANRGIRAGPDKMTAMQTALTEPDTGAVPEQQFEAILAPVAKSKRASITRVALQRVLHEGG